MKKRGKEKGIHIHLSNRLAYTLIAIFLLVAVGIGVYAIAPGVVPNPGHDINEVSVPSPCTSGQVLSYNGNNWVCVSFPAQTPIPTGLYGSCTTAVIGFGSSCIANLPAACNGLVCTCAGGYTLARTGFFYISETQKSDSYSCWKN